MRFERSIRGMLALATVTLLGPGSRAQCLDWRAMPGNEVEGNVQVLHVHPESTGPALYIAASFTNSFQARLLKWKNGELSVPAANIHGSLRAIETFDDGAGPALFVGGDVWIGGAHAGGLVRWDGGNWAPVGAGVVGFVNCLQVFDDGTGPALYAAGTITSAGGVSVNRIARWNGTSWSAVGAPTFTTANGVLALAVADDGGGLALFAAEWNIALHRYQGGTWSTPWIGASGSTLGDIVACDFGSGSRLFACTFPSGFYGSVRQWYGNTWQSVGAGGPFPTVLPHSNLSVVDSGGGPRLMTADFMTTGPPYHSRVWEWDGTSWSVKSGFSRPSFHCQSGQLSFFSAVVAFDTGSGIQLIAGGPSGALGPLQTGLWKWNATQWDPLIPPVGFEAFGPSGVRDLHIHDDGSGPALYACGDIRLVAGVEARGVVRWVNGGWQPLAGLPGSCPTNTMTTISSPTGPRLVIGSSGILEWTPGQWTSVGTSGGVGGVLALQEFGGDLYAGGNFLYVGGNIATNVARRGGTTWYPVGGGMNSDVNAFAVFDDGGGARLYAAGQFTSPANYIASWNGTSWASVGSGLNGLCDALAVFDDGTGPALFAAGTFTIAGGQPAARVARWRNNAWSALGAGLNAQVLSLGVFDDGSGPALYAGGNFSASGSTPVNHVAKWDGAQWVPMGLGIDGAVWTMQSFDDGTGPGPQLFVGGSFLTAGNHTSRFVAAWRGCGGTISRFCFGDESVVFCPCLNSGLRERGCENSAATGGARLNASGGTYPDTLSLYLGGATPGTLALLFQGDAIATNPIPLGDGLLCIGGSHLLRLGVASAPLGVAAFPAAGGPSISAQSAALGDPLAPGMVREYQVWYRDGDPAFCPAPYGSTSNLSNAVRVVW